MKTIIILMALILTSVLTNGQDNSKKSFYDFTVFTIDGQEYPLSQLKGSNIDPLYSWLTLKEENGVMDAKVKWNFQKFMIDEEGNLFDMAKPGENPLSEKIVDWVKK